MSNKRSLNRYGFTLVELLCVVCTVGLGTAAAAPKVNSTVHKTRIRSAGSAVNNAMMAARQSATLRGCSAVVHLGSGPNANIWVTTCKMSRTGVDTVSMNNVSSKFGVSLSSTSDSIVVTPVGLRADRVATTIKIRNTHGTTSDSVVVDVTGRVKRAS